MQELRLVAVSEDGSYAVLVVPGRSGRFALPIDERLRTVARGQFSRLAQYEIEVESPLRPKEIQDRIRAGETAEDIADASGLPVDRIRRFEGPVLAEREFRAQEAQRATVRGQGDSGPGPRLGDVVAERLAAAGASTEEAEWDSRKRQDGNWQVQLAYTVAGRLQLAEWVFDPRSRHVTADDDQAARLSLPEADWPAPRPGVRGAVTATVTPIGSRTGSGGQHHADQRSEADRPAGRAPLHPARQIPAAGIPAAGIPAVGVAASPGGAGPGAGQLADQRRASMAAETAAIAEVTQAPAGREARRGRDAAAMSGLSARSPVAGEAGGHRAAAAAGARARSETVRPEAGRAGGPAKPETAGRAADGVRGEGTRAEIPARPDAPAPAEDAEPAAPVVRRASGARSRRSSVPSWDEIMFGNSRQTD